MKPLEVWTCQSAENLKKKSSKIPQNNCAATMVSAARRQIIGGGGAPINKSRRRRRPQIVGGGGAARPAHGSISHTTILSETRSAYPIVCFPLVSFPIIRPSISYLTSHILGKSREVVSRCLPIGVFTETPSLVSVSFTIRPSSSLFSDVGFAYTGENSVVHHALSFNRGTKCRWRGGQLGGRGFLRHMPPFR